MKRLLLLLLALPMIVLAQTVELKSANVKFTGGTIDGAVIGGVTPAAANFTDVVVKTLGWSASGASPVDVALFRGTANQLQMRNGANAQDLQIFNNTDGTNYERGYIRFSGNQLKIGTEAGGTGTNRNIVFNANGGLGFFQSGGVTTFAYDGSHVYPNAAGSADMGAAALGWKRLYIDYTNTATVGAVIINKASGRINAAAAATSVVVTNSLVTAASHVNVWVSSADTTARVTSVVPAAGSFTVNMVAPTAQTSFDFQLFSAD